MKMRKVNTRFRFIKRAVCVLLVFMSYFGFVDIARQPSRYFASDQLTSPYIYTEDKGFTFFYLYSESFFRSIQFSVDAVQSFSINKIEKVSAREWLQEWKVAFFATPYAAEKSLYGEVSIYVLGNGDGFIHTTLKNEEATGRSIRYKTTIRDHRETADEETVTCYSFRYLSDGSLQIQKSKSQVFENQMCYIQLNRYQQIIGSWLFSPYFHYYNKPNGLLERSDTFACMDFTQNGNAISSEYRLRIEGNHIGENWSIISHRSILQIESAVTQKYLSTLDFNNKKIFTSQGFFYKTNQEGFMGETERTYYWDYSMYGMKSLLDFYENGTETLPYDLSLISLYALIKNQNQQGYWSNHTVSLWLSEKYGIQDGYYDTRFNIDAGLFALQMYEKYSLSEGLLLARKQGNLLMSFIQKGFTIKTKSYGYLIRDYICLDHPDIKTHASLNHLLNEALFLRQLSKITNEETYANSAKRIENGIKATEKLWYNKQSKDLNYCLDSRLHPSRTDYPLLTYHDLLRLIRYHQKHTHENLSIFIRLASFKENWLIKKNLIQVRKITKPE